MNVNNLAIGLASRSAPRVGSVPDMASTAEGGAGRSLECPTCAGGSETVKAGSSGVGSLNSVVNCLSGWLSLSSVRFETFLQAHEKHPCKTLKTMKKHTGLASVLTNGHLQSSPRGRWQRVETKGPPNAHQLYPRQALFLAIQFQRSRYFLQVYVSQINIDRMDNVRFLTCLEHQHGLDCIVPRQLCRGRGHHLPIGLLAHLPRTLNGENLGDVAVDLFCIFLDAMRARAYTH